MRELEMSVSLNVSFSGTSFRLVEFNDEVEDILSEVNFDTTEAARLSAFFLSCGIQPDVKWLREALSGEDGPFLGPVE